MDNKKRSPLQLDEKKITKNLKFNVVPGEFRGQKLLFPAHKTKMGIVTFAFKLRIRDVIKILLHRRIYVQQLALGKPTQGINLELAPRAFEKSVQENEDYYEKQELRNHKAPKGSES